MRHRSISNSRRWTCTSFPKMDLYIKGFIGGIWGGKCTFATFAELLRSLDNHSTCLKLKYIFEIVYISSFYSCFYIQDCFYGSWENPHQSRKNGEIFVSGCNFLHFSAWFSTSKVYTKTPDILFKMYECLLFIHVFTFKIACMDHEKSRIKVKKWQKFCVRLQIFAIFRLILDS